MDFEPTEPQRELQKRARKFATERLRPGVLERERRHSIGAAIIAELASLGFHGINVPRNLGGAEAGVLAYVMVLREIAAVDASVAVTMAVTNMVAEVICAFGTAAQRERYVPRLVSAEYFAGSFALSEAGAGSDAAALTTRAERCEAGWLIHGSKMWITSGDEAGVLIVWARTGGAGARGISCFLVDSNTPGITFGKPEDKMGLRASHTVAVSLDHVRVANDALLGELDQGFKVAMSALDGGRVGISAQAVGIGYAAIELMQRTLGARLQHDSIELCALADMVSALDAAWLLTARAASQKERGTVFTRAAAMAKVFASEAANRVVRQAVQILGEHGYMHDPDMGRLFRDCRVTQVYEGTSEIQRLVISRDLLKSDG